MPLEITVGTQWGDEGKGRIVDLLAAKADVVARYNGGDNAGHTINTGGQTFKLHLIPSGIVHPHTIAVLGNGMVINPAVLLSEMDMLRAANVKVDPERLRISYAAHLITPAHQALDRAQEFSRGRSFIGTTGRGIGPAYTDKAARRGLRLQDMLDLNAFFIKMVAHVQEVNHWLQEIYHVEPLAAEAVAHQYVEFAKKLTPYIGDVGGWLWETLARGGRVLAEGAQGTLLDLDFGTYPYVTSSNPTAAGALLGMGVGVVPVEKVVGVTKAFQSRVGEGPFPTELFDQTAECLRGTGANPWDEFGTTTGRPRRVGWLDGVLLRYAVRINGVTEFAVTKLDVLTGLPTLRVCTAYRCGDREYRNLLPGTTDLATCQPVYEELPGWEADIRQAHSWNDLPAEAQRYIHCIEEIGAAPVRRISVGPERDQIVEVEA